MIRGTWKGVVLAQSERTVTIEGNHYFPIEDVDREFLSPSATRTRCPWKGMASYYTVIANGQGLADAAWYYPSPSAAAAQITGHVAFWRGVRVQRVKDADPADRPSLLARLLGRHAS